MARKTTVAAEVEKACRRGWYDTLRETGEFGKVMALAEPETRRLIHQAERRADLEGAQ